MKGPNASSPLQINEQEGGYNVSRRGFLQAAGGFVAVGTILAACKKKSNNGISLGSGDTGLLNYAYALEQLEAAFYTQVTSSPYTSMTEQESEWLSAIRDHEIAHREFFKNLLGNSAIQKLDFDFSSVTFTDRASMFTAARKIEDLVVSGYNGAVRSMNNIDYITIFGKIGSVEARHAAYMHDMESANSFADGNAINYNGFDAANSPVAVLTALSAYIKNKIDTSSLPVL